MFALSCAVQYWFALTLGKLTTESKAGSDLKQLDWASDSPLLSTHSKIFKKFMAVSTFPSHPEKASVCIKSGGQAKLPSFAKTLT